MHQRMRCGLRRSFAGAAALLCVLAGCTPESGGADDAQADDYIQTVDRDGGPGTWQVAARPLLRIESDDDVFLGDVVGIAVMSSREVAVATENPIALRLFGDDGRLKRSIGRIGSGPGEYRSVDALARFGDTLAVVDLQEQAHIFDGSGRYLRREPRPAGGGDLHGLLASGGRIVGQLDQANVPVGGAGQTSETLFLAQGESRRVLGSFPSMRMTRTSDGESVGDLYSPKNRVAVFPDGFCAGYAGGPQIGCFDTEGRPVGTITLSGRSPVLVTEADREDYFSDVHRANPTAPKAENDAVIARMRERLVFAKELGLFGRLLPARDGALWVGPPGTDAYRWANRFAVPSEATTWSVFQRSGEWVADIELPPRFLPFEVGADYVAGITRDADDEVVLLVLDLVK